MACVLLASAFEGEVADRAVWVEGGDEDDEIEVMEELDVDAALEGRRLRAAACGDLVDLAADQVAPALRALEREEARLQADEDAAVQRKAAEARADAAVRNQALLCADHGSD